MFSEKGVKNKLFLSIHCKVRWIGYESFGTENSSSGQTFGMRRLINISKLVSFHALLSSRREEGGGMSSGVIQLFTPARTIFVII